MNILVRYHGIFAAMAACAEEQLTLPDGAAVGAALTAVGRRHPPLADALFLASGAPAPYGRPFVNGALAADLTRPLRDGDELALLPALAGGCYNAERTSPRAASTMSCVCGST